MAEDMIVVTDWDEVDEDDFYLSNEWLDEIGSKSRQKALKKMARDGGLFEAFEVSALSYVIYKQMDSRQVFINENSEVELICEGCVIGDTHKDRWEA